MFRCPLVVLCALCVPCIGAVAAADQAATGAIPGPAVPAGSATVPALDAATVARANAAADAYEASLSASRPAPSNDGQIAIAAAELSLLEGGTYLDQGDVTRAGDCYLAARKHLAEVPEGDRPLLGARLPAARQALAALSQRLLLANGDAAPSATPAAPDPADPAPASRRAP
jgi:hypothetical protein